MGGINPNAISTPQMAPYSPHLNSMVNNGGGESADYQISGRHNGLYLYFGRILKPVWLMPVARDVGKPQQPLLDSVVTSEELLTVLGQLYVIKGFAHANIYQNGPSSYQFSV